MCCVARYVVLALVFSLTPTLSLAGDLNILLQNIARHSVQVHSLQASFTQEKKLSFLKNSLHSTGHFFFTKNSGASPALLWEYLSPAPSGILFQRNTGWMWVEHRAKLKKAQGHEGNVLSSMIKQMLLWFIFEPQNLKQNYTMSLLARGKEVTKSCIQLVPKHKHFYTSMRICVSTKDYTISSLQFIETQGDSTTLFFKDICINVPFPRTFPDGTSFP